MKEVTRIITLEVTYITRCEDETVDMCPKEKTAAKLANLIEEWFFADHALGIKAQDFVMDLKEGE